MLNIIFCICGVSIVRYVASLTTNLQQLQGSGTPRVTQEPGACVILRPTINAQNAFPNLVRPLNPQGHGYMCTLEYKTHRGVKSHLVMLVSHVRTK
jgi:hypothetical protein